MVYKKKNLVDFYLSEIKDIPVLSVEEERELIKKAKAGDKEAFQKLISSYLKFVVSLAKLYHTDDVPLEDLINEGNMGLLRAFQHFDLNKNVRFLSYAVWWIRQAIFKLIKESGSVVRIPSSKKSNIKKVQDVEKELLQKKQKPPTPREIAEVLGIDEKEVIKSYEIAQRDLAIDAPLNEDRDTPLNETLFGTEGEEDKIINAIITEELKEKIKYLPEREKKVVIEYFGLGGNPPKTLKEIGEEWGVSRERVRQIKERALRKLRQMIHEECHHRTT